MKRVSVLAEAAALFVGNELLSTVYAIVRILPREHHIPVRPSLMRDCHSHRLEINTRQFATPAFEEVPDLYQAPARAR